MTMNDAQIDLETIVTPAVDSYMAATNSPGMAVAVIYQQDQQNFNYGYIDTEKSAAVTENTIFGIGSVTKVFTGILFQSAVNAGSMMLDEAVVRFLPLEVLQKGKKGIKQLTFRSLVTHTSGMPNEGGGSPAETLFTDQPPSVQLITWWEKFNVAPPAPSCWLYSNIGFVTLGYAVAGYAPNQYNTLLSETITTPLEMPDTSSSVAQGAQLAQGYIGNSTATTPARGINADLKSNGADMMKFLNACVFPDESTAIGQTIGQTQQPIWAGNNCDDNTPLKFQMGIAWQVTKMTSGSNTYSLAYKNGSSSLGGFEAWIGAISETTGVVLLSNKFMQKSTPLPPTLGSVGREILQGILDAANQSNA